VFKGIFSGYIDYPLRYYNKHVLTRQSSNGNIIDLQNVGTRKM